MSSSVGVQSIDSIPNIIDLFVGARIRQRRIVLGMTEELLARAVGLESDMVSALEAGSERLAVPRLHQLSQVLSVPISWFFSGLGPEGEVEFGGRLRPLQDLSGEAIRAEQLDELKHCFEALTSMEHRRLVLQLAQTLSDVEAKRVIDNSDRN